MNSDMHPIGLDPLSPTQSGPNQKQDAPNQTHPTSARQAAGAWDPGACPMSPRSQPVFCQLQIPHGRWWGGAVPGPFNCMLGTWSCVGIKPISLGLQIHNKLTLHQELGVSAAPRTFTSCSWTDLRWSPRLASPVPLSESPSQKSTGFAFHPVYGRPSSKGKSKASRQRRVSPCADPPPAEAGTCQGPDTGPRSVAADIGSGGTVGCSPLCGLSSLLLGLMVAVQTTGSSMSQTSAVKKAVGHCFHKGEGIATHPLADPAPWAETTEELALQWGCSQVRLIHEPQSPCLDEASGGSVPAPPSRLHLCPVRSPDSHSTATGQEARLDDRELPGSAGLGLGTVWRRTKCRQFSDTQGGQDQ